MTVLCEDCLPGRETPATAAIEIPPLAEWLEPAYWWPVCETHLATFLDDTRVIEFEGA